MGIKQTLPSGADPSALSPATSVVAETTAGLSSAVGTSLAYAREDHTHGTPAGGGGGTPGGSSGDIQYNNAGAFGGIPATGTGNVVRATSPALVTPTGIVKGDVGLGNVDNTSDATKNSATATLTNKTLTSPVINTPTGIVKGDVGLGNVDNTSDATKNSATATLTNKTLTTPTIGDFSNAGHNHTNAAGGGQLTDAALSAAVGVAKGGTGATTASGARTNLGLGTSAVLDVPASGNAAAGEVVKGSDTRLTDARTPTAFPGFTAPSFGSGWSNVGGGNAVAGHALFNGWVVLKGSVKKSGGGTTIFTLPSGQRPSENLHFATYGDGAFARVYVLPDGTVGFAEGAAASLLSLDTVRFIPQ